MVNLNLLRAKIVENNTTQESVANSIGMNRTTFYRKMKTNGSQFTVEEVAGIARVLSLSSTDIMRIFFAQ